MKNEWKFKKISDVCDVVNGGTPKTGVDEYWNGHHLWITPAEMGKLARPYVSKTKRMLSDAGLANSSARLMPPNSIILSSRAPIGHLVINTEPMATNQGCKGLVPKQPLYYKFLYYFLSGNVEMLNSLGTGATFKELSATSLKDLRIPVPPIEEQRRIVAILDEAFACIDKAKANTEKNIQNARELFDSYLNNIFSNPGPDWEETKLGNIAFVKSGGTPSRGKLEYWSGNIPWYSSGELGRLSTSTPERHINQLAIENSNAKVFPIGSLLIGMYDTAALKMSILDRDAAFNQAIAGVEPNLHIDLLFILHAVNSIKPSILFLRSGVRQKNLSLEKIKNIPIHLPSSSQQRTIVKGLASYWVDVENLIDLNSNKLSHLGEMKKSLLQKAFSGEIR